MTVDLARTSLDNLLRELHEQAEELKKKGSAFEHTQEYYDTIREQEKRMEEYKSVTVSSAIPDGQEAELRENPFKFLSLPNEPRPTYGQARAAWIRLSKAWFPDLQYPQNKEQMHRIFGLEDFVLDGQNLDKWLENLGKVARPTVLTVQELERLDPKKREDYRQQHETYRAKEIEYETVKQEMRTRALKKMQTINRAYKLAKEIIGDKEEDTFAGFEWIPGARTSEALSMLGLDDFQHDALKLEGNGEIRRDTGKWASWKTPYLTFDYREAFMMDEDYQQAIKLKPFFAWMELKQGKELSPALLDDLADECKLNENKAEQLRLMIMNREEIGFITKTLGITESHEKSNILWYLFTAYNGPMFTHDAGPRRLVHFPLGVELTEKGGMILKYVEQHGLFADIGKNETAQFSPADTKMMVAIAYGPLLAQAAMIK